MRFVFIKTNKTLTPFVQIYYEVLTIELKIIKIMQELNFKKKSFVDPFWITGFVDGEGCFCVSFNLKRRLVLGIEVRPSFSISQTKDKEGLNLSCLQDVLNFFSCGSIRFSKRDNTWRYECRDLSDIRSKILPHFEDFRLRTKKLKDFELFKKVVNSVAAKQHLNEFGLRSIIEISYQINIGKRKLTKDSLLSKINVKNL